MRQMASLLELDGSEEAFETSVVRITDKYPRYRKHIGRVCDGVRELKVDKKMPMVFVYSVKDDTYKAFF